VVLVCVVGVWGNEKEPQRFRVPHEIHLSLTNKPDEMRVTWFTKDTTVESGVFYGSVYGKLESYSRAKDDKLSDLTGHYHTAVMENLQPDTTYYYYVGARPEHYSDVYHFHTRRPDGRVHLIAFGDMGTEPRGDTSLFQVLRLRKMYNPAYYPDMVIHAGDLMYPFGNYGMVSTWFDRLQVVAGYIPYMMCPGNRDESASLERFQMPLSAGPVHPEPQRHNYYFSYDYNCIHFIFISTNFDEFKPGSHQYDWLRSDIAEATNQINDPSSPIKWIILVGHTPLYSSSNGHDQGNKELKIAIEDLLEPVTLAIWGDDHVYERSWPVLRNEFDVTLDRTQFPVRPKKPIHITAGTGGIDNDGWAVDPAPSWSAFRAIGKGYLEITADYSNFEVKFIDRDQPSTVVDSFFISNGSSSSFLIYVVILVAMVVFLVGFFLYGKSNRRWTVTV